MQMMLVLAVCALVSAQATSQNEIAASGGKTAAQVGSGLDLNTIVSRMTERQTQDHAQVKTYTVVRQYTLSSGTNETSDSKVVAEVSYIPPEKKYEIRETSGSGRGEKVVRRVLDHETQTSADWHDSAVTNANYEFSLVGREQSKDCNCYVLAMKPKREAKDLINGKAYVDPESFQIRRLKGELAKSPSWWVKHVDVTLLFNEVRGMWLQTAAHADADVRLFGRHVLDTHDIGYRTEDAVASNHPARSEGQVVRTGAHSNAPASRGRTSTIPVFGSVLGPR